MKCDNCKKRKFRLVYYQCRQHRFCKACLKELVSNRSIAEVGCKLCQVDRLNDEVDKVIIGPAEKLKLELEGIDISKESKKAKKKPERKLRKEVQKYKNLCGETSSDDNADLEGYNDDWEHLLQPGQQHSQPMQIPTPRPAPLVFNEKVHTFTCFPGPSTRNAWLDDFNGEDEEEAHHALLPPKPPKPKNGRLESLCYHYHYSDEDVSRLAARYSDDVHYQESDATIDETSPPSSNHAFVEEEAAKIIRPKLDPSALFNPAYNRGNAVWDHGRIPWKVNSTHADCTSVSAQKVSSELSLPRIRSEEQSTVMAAPKPDPNPLDDVEVESLDEVDQLAVDMMAIRAENEKIAKATQDWMGMPVVEEERNSSPCKSHRGRSSRILSSSSSSSSDEGDIKLEDIPKVEGPKYSDDEENLNIIDDSEGFWD